MTDILQTFRYMDSDRDKRKSERRTFILSMIGLAILATLICVALILFRQSDILVDVMLILVDLAFLFILGAMVANRLVATADIALDQDGLRIYLTERAYHHVPWVLLEDRSQMSLRVLQAGDGMEVYAVSVRWLPVAYHLSALAHTLRYYDNSRLMFIVSSHHADYRNLLKIIRNGGL